MHCTLCTITDSLKFLLADMNKVNNNLFAGIFRMAVASGSELFEKADHF